MTISSVKLCSQAAGVNISSRHWCAWVPCRLYAAASLCTGLDGEKRPAEQSLRHSGCSTSVGACGSLFDMQGSELAAILHICTHWNTRGIVVRGDVSPVCVEL